ncbi:methionine--tRNA ligase [candidate division WWE3 bacterium]|jgi:methionyl-tRNA synthetase|nr:methionine--tRNA ligase [candidate division WWE3 bacterium]MBT7350328.1 methionine--tRNA ligase [candidate division WWE3 bacterium]
MSKKTLVTTAIDYTNDVIHVGQAYEKILADCYARYERLRLGKENVGFVTGTDEHGTTNEKAAKERGITTKEHVDNISAEDRKQIDALGVTYDRWFRTTDEDHKKVASEFFKKSFEAGDIYKGTYEGLYCEGCEAYKTLTELNKAGQCSLHTTREIQKYEEENYFFKWSKYSDFLKELVSKETFVLPEGKRKAMLAFIENGIEDIPVTRPKYKLPWGITCPIDDEQVIYVWFDALINYYTFGSQNDLWNEDTKIVHFVGKDIARWHTLLWPAMLESAGYKVPDVVYVHGFLNLNGDKISKSKGNVIRPSELVEKYGVDAVRYYFLKYGPIVEDVNISVDHLEEVYNGELANGIGNTVARIAKLAERAELEFEFTEIENIADNPALHPLRDNLRTDRTIQEIWKVISALDKHVNEHEPWKITDEKKLNEVLTHEVNQIRLIAELVAPFIPDTAEKIRKQYGKKKISFGDSLFPRIEN